MCEYIVIKDQCFALKNIFSFWAIVVINLFINV